MKFNIGDWVRNSELNRIFRYSSSDMRYDEENPTHNKNDELWKPLQGEIVLHCRSVGTALERWIGSASQEQSFPKGKIEPYLGELPNWDIK